MTPVPTCAGTVVGRAAKFAQSVPVQRSTTKWVSSFDMSVHARFTRGGCPWGHVAERPIGAAGVSDAPTWITTVLDTESADMVGKPGVTVSPTTGPMAQTRYQ